METSLDPRAVHIYTDGSCYKNPGGESGCAATVHYPEHLDREDEDIVDFGCTESSNNRMELMACIKSLKWVRVNTHWADVTRIQIITDSMYVTENLVRVPTWKKSGWVNRNGQPIANADLWNELLGARARAGVRVDFAWQRGKKSPISKHVDAAAKTAAQRGGPDADAGFTPGGVSRSMVKDKSPAQPYPARGQVEIIRTYVNRPWGKGVHRISFNLFEEATLTYKGKMFAFSALPLAADFHMGKGYRVRFNTDPDYPQIVERIDCVQLPPPKRRKVHP